MSSSLSLQSASAAPEPVARIAEVMSSYTAPWALCGGWAVDAWLGRLTRDHGDVDIAVFQEDLPAFFHHLEGWQMVAHDPTVPGNSGDAWNGRRLVLPAHIHARAPEHLDAMPDRVDDAAGQGFGLDVQINERPDGDWLLSDRPRISLPLEGCIRASPWGPPAAVPVVLLFYKSLDFRRRDKLDFMSLLPGLSREERGWLREAVSLTGHPWLAQLSA